MNKILYFRTKSGYYRVNESGLLVQDRDDLRFSGNWKFSGVSFHHWRNGIDLSFQECFNDPSKMVKGLIWDVDHGTTRRWSERVLGAHVAEE